MILILEGLEGVGKTCLARAISKLCDIPVYRAFKTNEIEHWNEGDRMEAMLNRMGVIVNTHVEDLYAADLLTSIGGDVVLDRSMPSGMAYGIVRGLISHKVAWEAFRYWVWRLTERKDVCYVYLECDIEVVKTRSPSRLIHPDEDLKQLAGHLDRCYTELCDKFHAMRLDTSRLDKNQTLAETIKKLKLWRVQI